MTRIVLLLGVVALAAGCGSSKKKDALSGPAAVLPDAKSPQEWAIRIVDLFLRPLNKDLVVVNSFQSPQVRVYIVSKNAETLKVIHRRLDDLRQCGQKLTVIGPPPAGPKSLARVNGHFQKACTAYEDVAGKLLHATELLTSGRADVAERGGEVIRSARQPSGRAAEELVAAVKIAQSLPEFRRAGLKPSV